MAWRNSESTGGVTYRGYLGATGEDSREWLAQERWSELEALVRVAARAGRLGAWAFHLSDMSWTWSDEVRAIHEVGPEFHPTTETALAFYMPDSQPRIMAAFEACATVGTPFDLELELETGEGRHVWIRAIGEPERDADGEIKSLRGAIQDITSYKAAVAEAHRTGDRLARTLESLADGYIMLDRQWRFVYVNSEAERILRHTRSELIGKSMLSVFPETTRGLFLDKCTDAAMTNKPVELTRFYSPLGIWVHFKVTPTEEGLTFCIRDDSERVNMRREVLRLRAQLGVGTAAG